MKRIRNILFVISLFINFTISGQEKQNQFINDIAVPASLYMLSGVQNNIYIEPLIKRWRPYHDVVRFSGSANYQRRLARVASINNPIDSSTIKYELFNTNAFEIIKSDSSIVLVGESGVDNGPVCASIIGDSFTNGAFFKDELLDNGHVPNLSLIGLRKVKGTSKQYDEGRGGWTLNWYFTVATPDVGYNPFMQPDNKRYWGTTGFWKSVWAVINGSDGDGFEPHYSNSRYEDFAPLFNQKTGLKKQVQKSDVMYDSENESFIEWNGKEWVNTMKDDYTWNFNYETYLAMWKLKKPQFLFVHLGANDFRWGHEPDNIDFTVWNEQIESVNKSYKSVVPGGKFVVVIHTSTCGKLNNDNGNWFLTLQNACMWSYRKNVIDHFDGREDEKIYVVDGGIAIDSQYGYKRTEDSIITKPYEKYPGTESLDVQTGTPHPYLSYPEIGKALAAFIQRYR